MGKLLSILMFLLLAVSCRTSSGRKTDANVDIAVIGATIYPSPDTPAIEDGVVLVREGIITAVGKRGAVDIPSGALRIDGERLILTAGFWNSHVHFTDTLFDASTVPPDQLSAQMQAMLTQYGFTSVFDIGSDLTNTLALVEMVENGIIQGPTIFTTGTIIFPEGVQSSWKGMLTVATPVDARLAAKHLMEAGVHAVKIYAQAWWDLELALTPEIVQAVTDEAHQHGKLVFSHPSNMAGLEASLAGGVDILTHTTPQTEDWSEDVVARLLENKVTLIPTLKLWEWELTRTGRPPDVVQAFQQAGVRELAAYVKAGGEILFGTDVDYMTDYDTAGEFEQMAKAGMGFGDILRSLTTAPAGRFGVGDQVGRVEPGFIADLVLLKRDPHEDPTAFAEVAYTIRRGKVIYRSN